MVWKGPFTGSWALGLSPSARPPLSQTRCSSSGPPRCPPCPPTSHLILVWCYEIDQHLPDQSPEATLAS